MGRLYQIGIWGYSLFLRLMLLHEKATAFVRFNSERSELFRFTVIGGAVILPYVAGRLLSPFVSEILTSLTLLLVLAPYAGTAIWKAK